MKHLDSTSNLPAGKTCTDCSHFTRCSVAFGMKGRETECGFYPPLFEINEEGGAAA